MPLPSQMRKRHWWVRNLLMGALNKVSSVAQISKRTAFGKLRFAYGALFGLALIEIALALVLGQADPAHLASSKGLLPMALLIGCGFPLIWIARIALAATWRQVDRPTAAICRMIRRERAWLLRGAILATTIVVFARSYSSFKVAISRLNPFWADPWLIELDYMTFGADPWVYTHMIFGPFGTVVLDRIYVLWFFVVFATLGWFCFTRDLKLQIRGLLSYLLCFSMLGGLAAVSMSSVGPCLYGQFYGNDRFAPLMAKLNDVGADHTLFATRSLQFLIDAHATGVDRFGSGISAMPSLHVTIAFLSFLAICGYLNSARLKLLAGTYTTAIFVGSVHLGWHYAWDGIFGIAAVILFWWGSGKFVDWIERREARNPANPATIPLPARS